MGNNPRLLWGDPSLSPVTSDPIADGVRSPQRRWARFFSLMTLLLGLAYLVWLARLVLISRGPPDIFFFAAEALSYLLLCLLCYSTWTLQPNSPESPESFDHVSVDIFVPCCGEPLEIITTTLRAVRRINYHPLEVYVLDDGDSPAVAALA